MKILFSIIVLSVGLLCAAVYLRKPRVTGSSRAARIAGDRPWRRLGAAICLVLSIMFVLGLHFLDGDTSPKAYIVYWLIILLLVLWLCGVAFKDLMYTRRLIMRLRNELSDLDRRTQSSDSTHEDRNL